MAYEYVLSISDVNVNDTDEITDVVVAVAEGANDIDFADLTFTVTNAATSVAIPFTADNATKKLTFTTAQANTTAILIKAINTTTNTTNSNILLVDFNQAFDASGQATLAYTTPVEAGNYNITFKSVDGISIPPISKPLSVNNNADANNSSITYKKAYLSKRVNTTINVVATLKDASNAVVTGTDEVNLTAK